MKVIRMYDGETLAEIPFQYVGDKLVVLSSGIHNDVRLNVADVPLQEVIQVSLGGRPLNEIMQELEAPMDYADPNTGAWNTD